MLEGLLLVDKPADWTSFDVVNYVRRQVAHELGKKPKNCKVGHSGTLDPFATGLLILLIGKAYTKQADRFLKLDKCYDVHMRLGITSTTGDPEGVLTVADGDQSIPSEERLDEVLQQFLGSIEQVPPAYSAIKVDGQRAYALARAGKPVMLSKRPVVIRRIELKDYTYPVVHFLAEVSSGTYIRTLVEDIGKELGCGAYTEQLRRLSIGSLQVVDAVQLSTITQQTISKLPYQKIL